MSQLGIGNPEHFRNFLVILAKKMPELQDNYNQVVNKIGEFVGETGLASLDKRYQELIELKSDLGKICEAFEAYSKDGTIWLEKLDAINNM